MVTLDAVVSPLLVDMRDAVEMRIIASVLVLDHLPVGGGFIRADRDWAMQPDLLDCLAQEGSCGFRIAAEWRSRTRLIAAEFDAYFQTQPARHSLAV